MNQNAETENKRPRAVLLAADCGRWNCDESLNELNALCDANDMDVVGEVVQKRDAPDRGLFLGEGRIAEARLLCHNVEADLAVVDDELTGSQIRNLEDALDVEVIDRTMLILEIFANRAVTNEGKLQTELARLQYSLPRLAGKGASLSRQGGGGGGGGGARRGAGESKLELDRRYIRSRIDMLREKLEDMERRRAETRKSRQKNNVPVVALVGYTNVGKSSLLNRLCGAEVKEANMLFATLDPTARRLVLPSGLEIIMVDTVGFVSRLPHNLVQAFKSTLEEAAYADIILKVCNAADAQSTEQLQVTDTVLAELGCEDIEQLVVYNQIDRVPNTVPFDTAALCTSAVTGAGLDALKAKLDDILAHRVRRVKVLLPYDKLSLATVLREGGTVQKEEYKDDGLYLEGICRAEQLHLLQPYLQ